jgi:hypothetical protein
LIGPFESRQDACVRHFDYFDLFDYEKKNAKETSIAVALLALAVLDSMRE